MYIHLLTIVLGVRASIGAQISVLGLMFNIYQMACVKLARGQLLPISQLTQLASSGDKINMPNKTSAMHAKQREIS